MSFVPEEEIHGKRGINLAPMIDFLFLLLAFFATVAVTRITTRETEIDLVEVKPTGGPSIHAQAEDYHIIHITVLENGSYKWATELRDYQMTVEEIAQELTNQYEQGLLPENVDKTQVMLKVDKKAQWEPILKVIMAIRDAGFSVHPVYLPEESFGDVAELETEGEKA